MTEQEALTKWCPFSRLAEKHAPPTVANRFVLPPENAGKWGNTLCIGSACMAFRWLPDATATISGHTIRVDAADADLLEGCWWDGQYAKRDDGRLHRLIVYRAFGPTEDIVDHIDGDKTNCRRGNLRIVSAAENAANSAARGGASRFRGVSPARNRRWQAQISRLGVRKHLGTFDSEEEAAAAYDVAAEEIHGAFARPNLTERAHSGRHGFCGLAGKP